jgi:hypothetical protein
MRIFKVGDWSLLKKLINCKSKEALTSRNGMEKKEEVICQETDVQIETQQKTKYKK